MPASNIDCVHLKCPGPCILYIAHCLMCDSSPHHLFSLQTQWIKGSQRHEAGWYISFISIIIASATLLLTHSPKSRDPVQLSWLKQSPWLNPSLKFSALTNKKVNLLNKLYIKKTPNLKSKRIPIRERLIQHKQSYFIIVVFDHRDKQLLGLHLVVISSISIKFIVRFCLKHHLYNFSLHQVDIIHVNISMQTCFSSWPFRTALTREDREREGKEGRVSYAGRKRARWRDKQKEREGGGRKRGRNG